MDRGPSHGDELLRWARERAPAVLAQAEREAVCVLRDALVETVTRAREVDASAQPSPSGLASRAEPAAQGELLWAYCVLDATETHPADLPGVHPAGPVEREEAAGMVALVSRVPRAEFGAEPLRRNLNDLDWLERVARAHEAVLEAVLETATIVPLRMCTLYESAEGVRNMLARERRALTDSLATLEGRVEWSVKVIVDRERLLDSAGAAVAPEDDEHLAASGEGGSYMRRRRHDREIRELANSMAAEIAEQVHARLQDWAIDGVSRPPQNPELSGHEGQMLLNAAYLVDRGREDELRRLVAELEERHRELGARIELTGPWPPYNFVPSGDAAALT